MLKKIKKNLSILFLLIPSFSFSQIVNSCPDTTPLDLDSLAHALTYSSASLVTDTVQAYQRNTRVLTYYTQTITYNSSSPPQPTEISCWVKGSPV